jgi:hypothetical protein
MPFSEGKAGCPLEDYRPDPGFSIVRGVGVTGGGCDLHEAEAGVGAVSR